MKKGDIFGSGGFVDDDGVLRFELLFNYNVDFQYEITTRKYTTMLNKALEQKEIKEGLIEI